MELQEETMCYLRGVQGMGFPTLLIMGPEVASVFRQLCLGSFLTLNIQGTPVSCGPHSTPAAAPMAGHVSLRLS